MWEIILSLKIGRMQRNLELPAHVYEYNIMYNLYRLSCTPISMTQKILHQIRGAAVGRFMNLGIDLLEHSSQSKDRKRHDGIIVKVYQIGFFADIVHFRCWFLHWEIPQFCVIILIFSRKKRTRGTFFDGFHLTWDLKGPSCERNHQRKQRHKHNSSRAINFQQIDVSL